MPIPCYLAMTAAEYARAKELPGRLAWMACHFAPYGTGVVNLPQQLPEGSVLMLNDRIPIWGHDPLLVADMLSRSIRQKHYAALVLDLQRGDEETADMVAVLRNIECPVVVPQHLATQEDIVLLPPIPPDQPAEEYLAPWQGRRVWLEVSSWGQMITVSEHGASGKSTLEASREEGFADEKLFCHYRLELGETARFYLWRTWEDQQKLLDAAEKMGVMAAIGLYQELGQ